MPYNLRKRKAPEPEPEPEQKPAAKKPAARKPAVKKSAINDETIIKSKATKKPAVDTKSTGRKPAVKKASAKESKTKKAAKKEETEVSGDEATDQKDNHVAEQTNHVFDQTISEEPQEKTKKLKVEQPAELVCNQLMFGEDGCGELGLGKIGFPKRKPTPPLIKEKVKQVACGPMHTLSLTESGLVYSYGSNDEGALGRVTEDEDDEATPKVVKLSDKVTKITTGDCHSLALTEKQEVFIWGNFKDEHGKVGLTPEGDGSNSYEPIKVLPEKKFIDIASGDHHVLLLDTKGVVYSFGVGTQGQLGRVDPEVIKSTDKITGDHRKTYLEPQVVDLSKVDPQRPFVCDAIYAGNFSSFATNTDKKKNRLAGWGLNNFHQLGYKGQKDQLVQYYPRRSTFTCATCMIDVACGQHHTLFLTKTGRVYAAGRTDYGMLGIGKVSEGQKEVCPATEVKSGFDEPVTTLCAGIANSFAVDKAGKLFSWGMNRGNLGIGPDDGDPMVPTHVKILAEREVISVSTGSGFTAVIVKS